MRVMRKSPGLHETLTNTATIRADRQLQSTGADKNQLILFLSTEKGAVEYFKMEEKQMAFFQSAVGVLQTHVAINIFRKGSKISIICGIMISHVFLEILFVNSCFSVYLLSLHLEYPFKSISPAVPPATLIIVSAI